MNIELQKSKNEPLVVESIQQAKQLYEQYASEATFEQFASEVMVGSLTQIGTNLVSGLWSNLSLIHI